MEALAELGGRGTRAKLWGLPSSEWIRNCSPRYLSAAAPGWIGYIGRMVGSTLQIIPCPPRRIPEAVALVLVDLPPEQRRAIAARLLETDDWAELTEEALFVAVRGEELRGAAWGQRQSGNIAYFWPPQLLAGESEETARLLAGAVVDRLDATAVEMTQTLLPTADEAAVPTLLAAGFRHLADLLYLSCEANLFPAELPATELEFERYRGTSRSRLTQLVERTYQGTLDCVALNGMRTIDEVITGYQGTGVFRPENWLIVRSGRKDVGVLLLADHPQAHHWELIYMGLVPEVRGRGWGAILAEYAKWRARKAPVKRIVLAVDAVNTPALRVYEAAGFQTWDRRTVYARFPERTRP